MSVRHWSCCKGCGQNEYNDRLEQRDMKCGRCGRKVKLYVPSPKKSILKRVSFDDGASGGGGSAASTPRSSPRGKSSGVEDDVISHLRSALKAAKDPHMRQ
eukprot:4302474-Pyramimonas_sp.AAC.1